MAIPRDEIQTEMMEAWRSFTDSLHQAIDKLEKDVDEASEMASICTDEWCEATEHIIDELSNALFSISESRWSTPDDSEKIKALKRRVHDLYADYREVYRKAKG